MTNENAAPFDAAPLLRRASELHGRGALEPAETLYRQVLAAAPDNAQALHLLGVLEAQRTNYQSAADLIGRSLAIAPGDAMAHYNLGNVQRDLHRPAEALASYDRALALFPDQPGTLVNRGVVLFELERYDEALASYDGSLARNAGDAAAHFNRGNVLAVLKRHEDAIASYRRAIALRPNYAEAHSGCGNALGELGRRSEALAAFERALAIWMERRRNDETAAPDLAAMQRSIAELMMEEGQTDKASRYLEAATKLNPEDQMARYFLAAMSKSAAPDAPPDSYVAGLFDSYAEKFDHHIVDALHYRAPELIAAAVFAVLGSEAAQLAVVDLGCGTGLVAPLIAPAAARLVGIDLSERMLDRARERGLYHELIRGELAATLSKWTDAFDLAIAADVFVYVGNLAPAFEASAAALKQGGLLVFTVEENDGAGFVLEETCRYRHAESYLEETAQRHGFAVLRCDKVTPRYNDNKPVPGLLTVLRKS